MKNLYLLLALLVATTASAQIPNGYYDYATGTGYTLKTQLRKIIDNVDDPEINNSVEKTHQPQSYNSLDAFNATYELDNYYEINSNKILDIYSENPTGADPYTFNPGSDECGNYNSEGDCYNKEHVIPQSVFSSQAPMYSDAHHLLPTDGRVNGFRSNYPFGRVDNSQLVSQNGITNPTLNGSKLGNNLNSGYSAGYTGIVFEPIDEFKGDIARIYFYFATRYETQISSWSAYPMFDGSSNKVFTDTFLSILLTWHQNDPVSQKEIDRNNNIYSNHSQLNRNPFVDHPEYAAMIWSTTPDTQAPTTPTNLVATNPSDTTIQLNWTASTDNVAVTSYDIYMNAVLAFNSTTNAFTVTGLTPNTNYCFTVLAKDAANNMSAQSNQSCETTTNNGSGGACATETFETITTNSSSYTTVNWAGDNGLNWTATSARTDQTITGKALVLDVRGSTNGVMTSPAISGGIASLTVKTQRKFGGATGSLSLYVNDQLKGSIPYDDTVITTTIPNINVEGSVIIKITEDTVDGDRVAIDDLSWTCYSPLSVDEFDLTSIKVYPNPVNNTLHIRLHTATETSLEIYNVLGSRVLSKTIQESGTIQLDGLQQGLYILKITQGNTTISKKLIKN